METKAGGAPLIGGGSGKLVKISPLRTVRYMNLESFLHGVKVVGGWLGTGDERKYDKPVCERGYKIVSSLIWRGTFRTLEPGRQDEVGILFTGGITGKISINLLVVEKGVAEKSGRGKRPWIAGSQQKGDKRDLLLFEGGKEKGLVLIRKGLNWGHI